MTYDEAVKLKIERQKEAGTFVEEKEVLKTSTHVFTQSFIIQNNFEVHSFLGVFKRKINVGTNVIPTGLCEICNKLEIEHNE